MNKKKFPLPGKRFVNPLNKQVGRRTGRNFRAGKEIRVRSDGLENFDDYLSESDADSICLNDTRGLSELKTAKGKENESNLAMFQSAPVQDKVSMMSNITEDSVSISQTSQVSMLKKSRFAWLTNKNIGRRTGKDIRANRQIRVMKNGLENFDDYLSEVSDAESFLSASSSRSNQRISLRRKSSGLTNQSKLTLNTADDTLESEDPTDGLQDTEATSNSSTKRVAAESAPDNSTTPVNTHDSSVSMETSHISISVDKIQSARDKSRTSNKDTSRRKIIESAASESGNDEETHEEVTQEVELETDLHVTDGQDEDYEGSIDDEDPETLIDGISDANLEEDKNETEPDHVEDDDVADDIDDGNNVDADNDLGDDESMVEDELPMDEKSNDKDNLHDSHPDSNDDDDSEADLDDSDGDVAGNVTSRNDDDGELNLTKTLKTYERKTASSQKTKSKELPKTDNHNEKEEDAPEGADELDSHTDDLSVNDRSDIGGSQALSGLDVAGNRSGSITKLHDPGSAVSFDKTKKRLSYSALEASDKSKKMISDKVEKANLELAKQELVTNIKEKPTTEGKKSTAKKQTSQKKQSQVKDSVKDTYLSSYAEGNDFLCLSTRSIHTTHLGDHLTKNGEDSDTDISIIDDTKSHAKHRSLLFTKKTQGKGTKKLSESVTQKGGVLKETDSSLKTRKAKSGRKSLTKSKTDKISGNANKSGKNSSRGESSVNKKGGKVNRKLTDDMDDQEDAVSKSSGDELNNVESFVEDHLPDTEEEINGQLSAADESLSEERSKHDTKTKGNSKKKKVGGSDKTVKRKIDMNLTSEGISPPKVRQTSRNRSINNTHTEIDFKESKNKTSKVSNKQKSSEESDELDFVDVSSIKMNQKVSKKLTKTNSSNKGLKTRKSSSEESSGELESQNASSRGEKQSFSNKPAKSQTVNKGPNKRKSSSEESNTDLEAEDNRLRKIKEQGNKKQSKTKSDNRISNKRKSSSEESSAELDSEDCSSNKINKVGGKKQRKTNNNTSKKDKSSSGESTDRDSDGREVTASKKMKLTKGSSRKSGRKGSDASIVDRSPQSLLPSTELVHTPQPDSTQVPTNLQSGVSFRVRKRSEILENVTSGPLSRESIETEMEPSGGLTPCITKKGQSRKSKGRRVTICPEENTHHFLSADEGTFEDNPTKLKLFRHSMGMSDAGTPLPSPGTTPMHIFECTTSETPITSISKLPKGYHELPVEDRCIYPEPAPDGLRRSKRVRLKPVAWYKNEHIIWDLSPDTGEVVFKGVKPSMEGVYKKMEEIKRNKRQLRFAVKKASGEKEDKKSNRKLSIHYELPDDFCPQEKDDITVINPDTHEEDGIECIAYSDHVKPVGPTGDSPRSADTFRVTKLFDQPCMSVGTLELMPRAIKPESCVAEQALVFRILKGKLLVKIHNTSALLETADTFFVPYGNVYSLTNMRNDKAELFYTVHKFNDNDSNGDIQEENT